MLGAGGTVLVTGLVTVAVVVVIVSSYQCIFTNCNMLIQLQTSMYMDRAQHAPPRPSQRYPPLVHVDPPGTEPETGPDNAEDFADTPSTIRAPVDRRGLDIPIGEILPDDGPLLPSRSRRASSSSPTRSRIFSDALNGDASSQTSTDDARTIVPEREAETDKTEEETPNARDPNQDGYDYLQHIGVIETQGSSTMAATVSIEPTHFQRVRSGTIEDSDWTHSYSRTWHNDQGKSTAGYSPIPHIQVLTNITGSAASTASDSSESSAHSLDSFTEPVSILVDHLPI